MKTKWSFWIMLCLLLVASLTYLAIGCGDDDDDDDTTTSDDDSTDDDDDVADDDDDVTDDDDDDGLCEGLYTVIISGETDFGATTSQWDAKLTINASGTLIGVIVPADENLSQYSVNGFRYDAETGYIDGDFPTPESMAGECEAETIHNHVDVTVISGAMTGTVTLYCGEMLEENELGSYDATGTVTCGSWIN